MKEHQIIIEQLNGFLAGEFEVDPGRITPDGNVRQVLELDSLDYIDLVVVIENNFHFKVKPEDFAGITSFRDFYNYIIARVETKEPANAAMAGTIKG